MDANRLARKYTVIGVWLNDEPVPVGVVEGDHEVGGGDDAWDEGAWATSVDAPDMGSAQELAVQEMKENA